MKTWLTTQEAAQYSLTQRIWQIWCRTRIIPRDWYKKRKGRWYIHKFAAVPELYKTGGNM